MCWLICKQWPNTKCYRQEGPAGNPASSSGRDNCSMCLLPQERHQHSRPPCATCMWCFQEKNKIILNTKWSRSSHLHGRHKSQSDSWSHFLHLYTSLHVDEHHLCSPTEGTWSTWQQGRRSEDRDGLSEDVMGDVTGKYSSAHAEEQGLCWHLLLLLPLTSTLFLWRFSQIPNSFTRTGICKPDTDLLQHHASFTAIL